MPVTITFNAAAAAMKIKAATAKALNVAKPQIVSDCNEFCPKDDGTLRQSAVTNSTVTESGEGPALTVTYATPYARMLYYGIVMVDPKTKAAGFLTENGWRSRKNIRKVKSDPPRELKYSTPGTGKLWCETARNAYGEDWELIIQNALREELK